MSVALVRWVELLSDALRDEGLDDHARVRAMERATSQLGEDIEGWKRTLDVHALDEDITRGPLVPIELER